MDRPGIGEEAIGLLIGDVKKLTNRLAHQGDNVSLTRNNKVHVGQVRKVYHMDGVKVIEFYDRITRILIICPIKDVVIWIANSE